MYTLDYNTVQVIHQERVRKAEQWWELHLLRDATEQGPVVVEAGLVHDIKQWFASRSRRQRQEVRDVRRATAV
jgi:hypothetical protein